MTNPFSSVLFALVFISTLSNAQTATESQIKCEIHEVIYSDTGKHQVSVLATATKPLSGFWLIANAEKKGHVQISGGIKDGVASGIVRFKDLVGNHSVVQSMTLAPGSQFQIELASAAPTNGFIGTSIRLVCDISAY